MEKRGGLIKVFLRWLPSLTIMVIIFFVSSRPSTDLPNFGALEAVFEIGGHMLGYGLLALSLSYAAGNHHIKSLGVAGVLAFLYSISDEMHQSFVPGRDASLFDVGIDLIGIFLGLSTMWFLRKTSQE
jgi:VanZ family protein